MEGVQQKKRAEKLVKKLYAVVRSLVLSLASHPRTLASSLQCGWSVGVRRARTRRKITVFITGDTDSWHAYMDARCRCGD